MLDLVREEEWVAHLTGLGFEELLSILDDESPADLCERYAEVADRYLVLSGKGHRSDAEELELDVLDSALRVLLGETSLLVLAGRLLTVLKVAWTSAVVFRLPAPPSDLLLRTRLDLGRLGRIAEMGLKGPVPVETGWIAERARRASEAAAALSELEAGRGTWGWLSRKLVARRGLSKLLDGLTAAGAPEEAWEAARGLFSPDRNSSAELVQRLMICHQAVGLVDCMAIAQKASRWVRDLAALVREGLGA